MPVLALAEAIRWIGSGNWTADPLSAKVKIGSLADSRAVIELTG